MRKWIGVLAVIGVVVGAFALGQAVAQEEENAPGGGMDDMAVWEELGKPGPEHAEMAKLVGKWECEAKSWMAPGAEPVVEEGKCTYSMALDGRILRQDYEGTMMGTPFTGLGFTAYNKATRKYEAIWMDSGSTGIFMMTGESKPDGTWEYAGTMHGPGGVPIPMRTVLRHVSDDEQLMEMYSDMGQGEMKSMEMTYKRVK